MVTLMKPSSSASVSPSVKLRGGDGGWGSGKYDDSCDNNVDMIKIIIRL